MEIIYFSFRDKMQTLDGISLGDTVRSNLKEIELRIKCAVNIY